MTTSIRYGHLKLYEKKGTDKMSIPYFNIIIGYKY